MTIAFARGERESDDNGAWRSLASAPEWGSGGRWFESSRPDIRKASRTNRLRLAFCLGTVSRFTAGTTGGTKALSPYLGYLGQRVANVGQAQVQVEVAGRA